MQPDLLSLCPRTLKALRWAKSHLAHTTEAELAAKMLLAHVLDCRLTDLFVHPERPLSQEEFLLYQALIARRAAHEPVAYLVGHQPFLDLDLMVNSSVLIPRPETEVLVEAAIRIAGRWSQPRIADVGTGCGAIAISLAMHLPDARILAVDASERALEVGRHNTSRYGLDDRIRFLQSDLLTALTTERLAISQHQCKAEDEDQGMKASTQLDIIVANLPYVSEAEYAALSPDIRLYEPPEALIAGQEGLRAIRALLDAAPPHLAADGAVLLEIGADQGPKVSELAALAFPDAQISVLPDYAHRDRVLCIERA